MQSKSCRVCEAEIPKGRVVSLCNICLTIRGGWKGMGKFYTFRQNNSGGSFDLDENLQVFVIVEAENAEQANVRAEDIGIYFNGCADEVDCECCGDRWYEADESDADIVPTIHGKPVNEYLSWSRGYKAVIHYLSGRKEIIELKVVGE